MTGNSLRLHVKMENLGKDSARSVYEGKDQNQRLCSKDSSGRELLRTPKFGRCHVGLTPRRSPGRCLGKFVPAARLSLLPVIAVVRSRPLQAPRDRLVSSVAILGHGSNTPRTVKIAKSEPLYKYQSYIFHPFPHYLQIPELWRSFQSPQLTGMSIRGGPILFSLDISTLQRPKT